MNSMRRVGRYGETADAVELPLDTSKRGIHHRHSQLVRLHNIADELEMLASGLTSW